MISKNHLNNQKIAGNLFLFPVDWAVQLSKTRKDFKMISARNHFHGNVKEGKKACIFVKATEVMLANENLKISARNQWKGTVKEIQEGAVNAIVKLEIEEGVTITSTISLEAVKDLGLTVGAKAVAIVKSTSVMLGEE